MNVEKIEKRKNLDKSWKLDLHNAQARLPDRYCAGDEGVSTVFEGNGKSGRGVGSQQ